MKTINTVSNVYYDNTNIKQFDINYSDNYCLVFYNDNKWYIIPYEILINPNITFIPKIIESFPWPIVKEQSNNNAIYFEITYNNKIISNSMKDDIITIPTHWASNIIIKNLEVQQYYNYINNIIVDNLAYDIDVVKTYCSNNFLDFSLYQPNTLNTNSLIILIILNLLYNNNNLIFTYWKKYNVFENNEINFLSIINNNYFPNEWKENLDNIIIKYFSTNTIYNQINNVFNNYYLLTSVTISNLYNNLSLSNAKDIYIKLKVIFDRFYNILNNNNFTNKINFNNNFLAKIYSLTDYNPSQYNNNNYNLLLSNEYSNYHSLINTYGNLNNIDFTKNITPIDLQNIFGLIAYDISNYSLADKTSLSFLTLWRNCVFIRLYNRFSNVFNITEMNSNLYDLNLNRRLTLYYSIFPQDMYYYEDFQNSFYEMFYKNSFMGYWNINNDKLIDTKSNIFNIELSNLQNTNNNFTFNNNFFNLSLNKNNFYIINKINKYNYSGQILSNNQVYNDKLVIYYNNYYNNHNFEINLVVNNFKYNCNHIQLNKTNLIIDILKLNIKFSINQQIKIIINYNLNLPLISFYKENLNYPYFNYSNMKPTLNLELIYPNTNTFIDQGYHKYGLVFSNTKSKTEMLYITTIDVNNYYVIKINFSLIRSLYQNSEYTNINIYRTKKNDTKFYFINSISINSTEYLDNKTDNLLTQQFVPSVKEINNKTLNLTTINKNTIKLSIIYNPNSVLLGGNYMYGILVNGLIDNISTINISNNQNVVINNYENSQIIYRTKVNETTFYLLPITNNTDNIPDSELEITNNINKTIGYFTYGITFFSHEAYSDETEIDYIESIFTNNQYVKIKDLPIKKNYLGRKIYRRDSITNTFYLLDIINNIDTYYIDYFNKNLSITYNYKKYDNIPYNIITDYDFNNTDSIILYNELSYKYLYYLIYKNNFQDFIKLYPKKKYMSYTSNTQPFIISLSDVKPTFDWYISVNEKFIINNSVYITDNKGNYTIDYNIITNNLIKQNENDKTLRDENEILIVKTGYYVSNNNYYYNDIRNSLISSDKTYQDVNIINLTSFNIIGNYGVYQENLYQYLNGAWKIVVSGQYHNLIDDSYYFINVQNSITNIPNLINNTYYSINNKDFEIITPYLVDNIANTIYTSGYIINNYKLYLYNNNTNKWTPVKNSYYYKTLDNYFIQTDTEGTISFYNSIKIKYYNSFVTASNETYGAINNKLYYNNNGIWSLVINKFYYDDTTTNRIYVDLNGIINIITPIIIDGTIYSIENGNLLYYNTIVTSGYFILGNKIKYINIEKSLKDDPIIFETPINYEIIKNNLYINNILQQSGNFIINKNRYSIKIENSSTQINILTTNYRIEHNNLKILKPSLTGNYNYKISFYNQITHEESYLSDSVAISNKEGYSIKLSQLSPIYNKKYNSWNIYRTLNNGTIFYKIGNILDTIYNAQDIFTDTFNDEDVMKFEISENIFHLIDSSGMKVSINNLNKDNYKILQIPIHNITPNLHSFISHSTDIDFMNNKQILDCYDYIFNKPFLMLVRTENNSFNNNFTLSECFTNNLLYFYNIPFLINSTTIIKLENYNVDYVIPISTQQFFIKDKDTPYYTGENYFTSNIVRQVLDYEISQNTFNPAYDSFNGPNNNLISIIDTLNNYNNIIDIINQTNNNYLNIFSYIKNQNIYGSTTLNYIFNTNVNNLFNYTNYDYNNYSHYAIFPFIYNKYISGNKITAEISTYLQNISLYFQSYINNYYSIISDEPSDQNITNIVLLHPIIDDNIYQIKIDDNIYDNPIIENNTISMNYSTYIPKKEYVEKIDNYTEKFKFIGIINLDTINYKNNTYNRNNDNSIQKIYNGNLYISSSKQINLININKYYYKIQLNNNDPNINLLIDNILHYFNKVSDFIYEIYSDTLLNLTVNKYYINTDSSFSNITNVLITNIFNNKQFDYYTTEDLSNYTYYSYDNINYLPLTTNGFNSNNTVTVANFNEIYYLCNDNIIYKQIKDCLNPYLISLTNSKQLILNKKYNIYYKILLNTSSTNIIINVNFNPILFTLLNNNYLEFYLNTLSEFQIYVNNILYFDYTIIDFKEYNYYSKDTNTNFTHYTINSEIYYQITNLNSQYFIIDSDLDTINVTICNFDYNSKYLKPSIVNVIDKLYVEDPNYYILCSDINTNINIVQIKNINNLEKNKNYYCWLYKDELLINNLSTIPNYSFFEINNNYYYYDPDNVDINSIIINSRITTFNVLDNNMFDNIQKQLLKIKYDIIDCIEGSNYIKLNDYKKILNNELYYKRSDNTICNIIFNENNILYLSTENEFIDYTDPIFPNIITTDLNYINLSIPNINLPIPNINGSAYVIINSINNLPYHLGSLSENYLYEPTNPNMIINGSNVYITIKPKNNITLWKINVITLTNQYHIYIWTIVNENNENDLNIPKISQPYYSNNTNQVQTILGYKYYTFNRHIDNTFNYEILRLNYNSIFNITNTYVYNKIILMHNYDIYYYIVKYDKLYLEIGETIILDTNQFIVLGLNIFNNYYELKLIIYNNRLLYNYEGYYSSKKYNNIKIEAKTNNIYKFNETFTFNNDDIGRSYLDNSIMKINLDSNKKLNNIFININKPIKIILFHSNQKLYLFDDFINLAIGDKLIYDKIIYNIIYIKDNEIFIDSPNYLDNNKFYDFILVISDLPNNEFCFTDNSFKINETMNKSNININNNYSLEIDIKYHDINSVSTLVNIEVLNIYYYQPVYINGIYNTIVNCSDNIIYLLNPLLTDKCDKLILSPINNNRYFINDYEIYYNNKLDIINDSINYISYDLSNNSWGYTSTPISLDNIIYFHKYKEYDKDYNFNIGSYHLLINSENIINLVKIIDKNKFNFNDREGIYYLDKIFKCTVDSDGFFEIENINIIQLKKTFSENKNKVEIIKKYDVKILNYSNKRYNISFINEAVNNNIYNKIYIDNIDYDFIKENNNYYIITNSILDDFTVIYTKNINWIDQTIDYSNYTKYILGSQPNNNIYNINGINYKNINSVVNVSFVYINNNYNNIDYYSENINLSLLTNTSYSTPSNLNNSYTYNIYDLYHTVTSINQNIITVSYQLPNNQINLNTNIYLQNKNNIDVNNFIFKDFKHIKDLKNNFSCLKPWKNWTLLSYNFNLKNIGLKLENYNVIQFSNNNYYLTINEIEYLTYFLLNNKNYTRIKNLDNLLRNNIYNNWIKNPFFFNNIINNINNFLNTNKYTDFYFNGEKLLYSDKNQGDIIYITDEFTFESNAIYRNKDNYNKVISQINEYINTGTINNDSYENIFFGISINDLLKYLTNMKINNTNNNNQYSYTNNNNQYSYTNNNNQYSYTNNNQYSYTNNNQYSYTANYSDISSYNLVVDTIYNMTTDINNINILPYLVNFTSSYLYDNFFILKEEINYNILNFSILGLEYNLSFTSDEIYYNGNQLMKINNNYIINIKYITDNIILYDSNFTIILVDGKVYINFNNNITYMKYKTFINISNNNYLLEKDDLNKYYINYTLNETITSFTLVYLNYDLINTNSFFEVIEKHNIILLEYQFARQYINNINNIKNAIIQINGLDYHMIDNYIEINYKPSINDNFIIINKICFTKSNFKNGKQYIILNSHFIFTENMLIKIINTNYILYKDDKGYYINIELNNIKFNDNIKLLEYISFNKIQYLDIYDINFTNDTYITFNTNMITQQYLLKLSHDGRYYIETTNNFNQITSFLNVTISNSSNIYYGYLKYFSLDYSDYTKARQYINIINFTYTDNSYIELNNSGTYFKIHEDNKKYFIEVDDKLIDNIITANIKQIVQPTSVKFCDNIVYKINVEEDITNNLTYPYDYIVNDIVPNKIIIYDTNTILLYHNSLINTINNLTYNYRLNHNYINKINSIIGFKIIFENEYQYSINDKLYIFSRNVNKYFYKLYIDSNDNLLIDSNNKIILYIDNKIINSIVYSILYNDSYYIISFSEKIKDCSNIKYNTSYGIYTSPNLIFLQNSLIQVTINSKSSQNNFNEIIINENISIGEYLVLYDNFSIINNSNNGVFIETMKPATIVNNIVETTHTNTIVPTYDKLFDYIRLYFNDQLIDELNENIFNINYNLYASDEMKKNIDKLTLVRQSKDGYQLLIPINFWFYNNPSLSLPLISMPYTNIRLVYKSALNIDMEIKLLTDFIILDTEERKLFGSLKYEYIIQTYKTFPSIGINSSNTVIDKHFSGLIKDIYLITDPYIKSINNYDIRFNTYIQAYDLWLLLLKEKKPLIDDTIIINENENEYEKWQSSIDKSSYKRINNLISNFSSNNFNLIKFLMFFQDKYLSSPSLSDSRKNYIIFIYLKYQFRNEKLINNLQRINSLIFHGNGTELFSKRDYMYFNYVIPYTKFKNTLPNNYYVYTFSLNPRDDQFSGHLNYTNLDDSSITILSNPNIFKPYNLQIVVKQYNILKIISGIGNVLFN